MRKFAVPCEMPTQPRRRLSAGVSPSRGGSASTWRRCVSFLFCRHTTTKKKKRRYSEGQGDEQVSTLRITHQHESRLRIFPPAQCCPHCLPEHSIEIAQAHFSPSFDTRLLRWEYHQEPCGLFEGDARTRTILEIALVPAGD